MIKTPSTETRITRLPLRSLALTRRCPSTEPTALKKSKAKQKRHVRGNEPRQSVLELRIIIQKFLKKEKGMPT